MIIDREITHQEMLRRFAVGEVYSEFYTTPIDDHRQETLRLLRSEDPKKEIEGINRALAGRLPYVNSVPRDMRWSLAKLPVTMSQFSLLRTINRRDWVRLSGGTQKLTDAATFLHQNPGTDLRVDAIISAFKKNAVEMQGVTLIGKAEGGPFTILEGTGRLVSLYLCCIAEKSGPNCPNELEIVFGLSSTHWGFS